MLTLYIFPQFYAPRAFWVTASTPEFEGAIVFITRQTMYYKVTLRRVRETIDPVVKQ